MTCHPPVASRAGTPCRGPAWRRDYLMLGAIRGSVNLPELSVGSLHAPSRLVHIHHDRPGVMAHVNSALSAAGLNVSLLHLETQSGFGVAVIDVSAAMNATTLASLHAIEGTVRVFTVLSSTT